MSPTLSVIHETDVLGHRLVATESVVEHVSSNADSGGGAQSQNIEDEEKRSSPTRVSGKILAKIRPAFWCAFGKKMSSSTLHADMQKRTVTDYRYTVERHL